MGFVGMSSRRAPLTPVARSLCGILINGRTTPDIHCPTTGLVYEGKNDWPKVYKINEEAVGAHYLVMGFYYLLCWSEAISEMTVAIHSAKTRELIGTVVNPNEIEINEQCFENTYRLG